MPTTRARAYRITARRWLVAFVAVLVAYTNLKLTWSHADMLRGPLDEMRMMRPDLPIITVEQP